MVLSVTRSSTTLTCRFRRPFVRGLSASKEDRDARAQTSREESEDTPHIDGDASVVFPGIVHGLEGLPEVSLAIEVFRRSNKR